MNIGSFFSGPFLGSGHSSTPTYEHNVTIARSLIQYPNAWDKYADETKLKWLRNRGYWHEYYELQSDLYARVKFKLAEEANDNIYAKVLDSLIKNQGDTAEAEQLFAEYLNKRYMFKVLTDPTRTAIRMEVEHMNDYIQHNYPSASQSGNLTYFSTVWIDDFCGIHAENKDEVEA